MQVEIFAIARLIKRCAFEMNAYDKREIDATQDRGETWYGPGCTSGPSDRGEKICQQTATAAGLEPLGYPIYLLLAYSWNDALDWADDNGGRPC
jgi:hypothetical protein